MNFAPTDGKLVRAIGRWSLTALMINTTIGSGIFGFPSIIAGMLGFASVWAYVAAGACLGVIILCNVELGSQFRQSGGQYLYIRAAFGRFPGILAAWSLWLARIATFAANANLFVLYLAEFWPDAKQTAFRLLIISVLIGVLAAINVRGVRGGANLSNVVTIAKIGSLLGFIALGGVYLARKHALPPIISPAGAGVGMKVWLDAIVLLIFAFGGFDGVLPSGGEFKDPHRDVPFALLSGLAVVAVVYILVQVVVLGTLPLGVPTDRPLAQAARVFLGSAGAALMSLAAMTSVCGHLSAQMVNTPRLTLGLAEQEDFPQVFGLVHPRFRTPYVSIATFAGLCTILACLGSFQWNAVLSVAARLICFLLSCAALPVLRRKQPHAQAFRLPAGIAWSALGVVLSVLLLTRLDRSGVVIVLITMAVALINWIWARQRTAGAPPQAR